MSHGLRKTFKKPLKGFPKGPDSTSPGAGTQRPTKKPKVPKPPKDTGRKKRKVKITFNSPKTTKITYG